MPESATLEELRAWNKACDPHVPIGRSNPYFVDFNCFEYEQQTLSLRGATTETGLSTLVDAILMAEGSESCHLFSGFSGTGKSSELLGLEQELADQGYAVLIADSLEYLNLRRPLEIAELLVVTAAAFGDVAARIVGRGAAKPGYLARFVDFVKQDVDLENIAIPTGLDDLKVGINFNQPFWIQARDKLAASVGKLREHARAYVAELVEDIREHRERTEGVVFVLDSLEKVRGTQPEEFEDVLASVIEVFGNQAALLRFPLHMVYTIPPYVRQLEIGTAYDHVTEVLPVIRVHQRGSDDPYEPGVEALSEVVRRRIPVARIFGEDEALLRRLVICSGGHVRLLLTLVRDTLLRAKRSGLPVDAATIERVLQPHREVVERTLWRERLPILRDVLDHQELPGMSRTQLPLLAALLDDYTVLCYRNGDGWYDVHPLARTKLRELLAREAAGKGA